MLTSTTIKKFFKVQFSIPVRVRKVAVKRPFFQVWIESTSSHPAPLAYSHEFPATLGNQLLNIVYTDTTNIKFPAGNIQTHSLSFDEAEWDKLMLHYPLYISDHPT